MSEKFKKIQVAKITVFITSIFVIFLSVTYALVGQVLTGSKRQVVTAGDIRIRLDEENEITINNAMPVYDEVGMIGTPFKFQVVNEGSSKANYILKLIDITTGDESTKLSPSLVRYGLTKDGETTIKNLSSAFSSSIDRGSISGNQTINYELRLWIDFKVEEESLIKDKTLQYKIGIEVEPPKQYAKYDAMMRSRTSSSSTDYFWKYSKQITSIVFEPAINIPEGVESWDVSATANSGQVMAYVEDTGETVTVNSKTLPAYKLHIQAKNGVASSSYAGNLFYGFRNLASVDGLEYFDTSNAIIMSDMFSGCSSLTSLDVSNFDTSKVIDMSGMFSNCNSLTNLDLSHFDTSRVTTIYSMFYRCDSLVTLNLSNFDTSNVTSMSNMFYGCSSLFSLDMSYFDTSKVTSMNGMFGGCDSLKKIDIDHFDTSKVTNMRGMFQGCDGLTNLDLTFLDVINVTDMSYMFSGCVGLVDLNLSGLDASSVTSMREMFSGCNSLITLDLSNFTTLNLENVYMLFFRCSSLTNLDLSSFNTSNVTSMADMFYECNSLSSLNLSSFNTSNVTDMSLMFSGCSNLSSLNLSSFNTSNVTDMSAMFQNCGKLATLDLSNFDTSKVTDMGYLFLGCSSLAKLDISNFDFTNVVFSPGTSPFNGVPTNSLILVKDEIAKTWVLGVRSDLTNVQVKTA